MFIKVGAKTMKFTEICSRILRKVLQLLQAYCDFDGLFLTFWALSCAKACKTFRSRKMLQKEFLLSFTCRNRPRYSGERGSNIPTSKLEPIYKDDDRDGPSYPRRIVYERCDGELGDRTVPSMSCFSLPFQGSNFALVPFDRFSHTRILIMFSY